jgi:hypothetical protein
MRDASPNIIRVIMSRRIRVAGNVACMIQMRNAYDILVRRPEGKRPLGRSKRRREDNIRMDLRDIGWNIVNWIHLAQGRDQWQALLNTVMKLQVP